MGYAYPAVAGSQQNDKKNVEIALASLKGTAVNFAVHSIKEARGFVNNISMTLEKCRKNSPKL